MTAKEIAKAFSNGNFEKTFPFLAADITWMVMGENQFTGKDAVVRNCEQITSYFNSVTTDFRTLHVIEDRNKIAITGTAEFSKNGKKISFVSSCDVYEFNPDNTLARITSYCIPQKSK